MALMKIGNIGAIAPLKTALSTESDITIQPVLQLAISQLEKRAEEADSWD